MHSLQTPLARPPVPIAAKGRDGLIQPESRGGKAMTIIAIQAVRPFGSATSGYCISVLALRIGN